jgi:pilus assembly protein CpaE
MPERRSPTASRRITAVGNPTQESRDQALRGTVIAVYGTRADAGVPAVAAALASAVRRLVTDDVVFAELESRPTWAGKRSRTPRGSRVVDDTSVEQIVIPGTDAALVRRNDGVWTLALARGRGASVGDAKTVITALDAMRDRFPVSVAELGHQLSERTLAAFDAADRILLVTEGTVTSLRGVQRVLRLCRRLNYPDEKLCVVTNCVHSAGSLAATDIAAVLKRELFWRIPVGDAIDVDGLAQKLLEG